MCWLPRTTSNSCRPFLSGSGQFLSSSLRARSAGGGASQAHSLRVAVGGGSRWAATERAGVEVARVAVRAVVVRAVAKGVEEKVVVMVVEVREAVRWRRRGAAHRMISLSSMMRRSSVSTVCPT